jgi:two-component system phosphate regulon sensor histidine kinase PhoR
MVRTKPINIAFFNAFLITLICFVFYSLYFLIADEVSWEPLLFMVPVVFTASFLIIKYAIEKFIYERIKAIYQTIGKLKTRQDIREKQSQGEDVIEIVNQAVLDWSDEQKEEIAELKRMANYRREFLGNVSHELKTPIFNIQGYILTLLDGGLQDDEINVKFLKRTKKSVNRLIAIVEDLEEISKFQSGEMILKLENFDIGELINDVADYMEMKATENNASITLDFPLSRGYLVHADKKRIRQILINLIDNAIKYGDKDNGSVILSIYDFHDYFLIEVSDNGIGIPEEYLFRVFERFFRSEQARARQKSGSGLGLAIVKHIIEAHNQKITVRNNQDKGSTFSFSIQKA